MVLLPHQRETIPAKPYISVNLPGRMMNIRLQRAVTRQVMKHGDAGCWAWIGQIANSGHGRMKVKYDGESPRMDSARNVCFRAYREEIPKGMMTRPTCGNLYCINPQHLELFDPEANRKRLQSKGID